jgi:hypothetical protein
VVRAWTGGGGTLHMKVGELEGRLMMGLLNIKVRFAY